MNDYFVVFKYFSKYNEKPLLIDFDISYLDMYDIIEDYQDNSKWAIDNNYTMICDVFINSKHKDINELIKDYYNGNINIYDKIKKLEINL